MGEVYEGFAEVRSGDLSMWLSTAAPVASGKVDGLTLHEFVDDVDAAARVALQAGATLVHGPVDTDFGMRSAVFRGPGALLVDVCQVIRSVAG